MTEMSSTNYNQLVYYFQSDVEDELKQLILRNLKDKEIESLHALCLSRRTVLIAEYLVRAERSKRRNNKGL